MASRRANLWQAEGHRSELRIVHGKALSIRERCKFVSYWQRSQNAGSASSCPMVLATASMHVGAIDELEGDSAFDSSAAATLSALTIQG